MQARWTRPSDAWSILPTALPQLKTPLITIHVHRPSTEILSSPTACNRSSTTLAHFRPFLSNRAIVLQ
jgi:hypothetical protein